MGFPEMGLTDRCIDKNHLNTPSPWRLFQLLFRSSQFGKSLSAFSCYKRLQSELYEGGLFRDTCHPGGLIDQTIINIKRCSHDVTPLNGMRICAHLKHICQVVFRKGRHRQEVCLMADPIRRKPIGANRIIDGWP